MLTRLVRYINVSIAILLLLAAAVVYWFAIRPLPQLSGEIRAPLERPGFIKRDAHGIPHIEAQSLEDALFLQGYATAQDRLWQIDGLRRFARGELAEIFGSGLVATDERSRRMRMGVLAESAASKLVGQDRAAFSAYARGVNFFINQHRGRLQLEFSLPGQAYDPKPWTIADSIAVGLVMFRNMTDTLSADLDRAALASVASDPKKLDILLPAIQGGSLPAGSNAWAVSGAHTVDGRPMLENDTHLDYGIPATWHLIHLKAPDLNVTGCTLPGVPGVIIGHNEQIAWGVTNLGSDVMDLYSEQLNSGTGRYLFRGQMEQAQLDTEYIGVHGSSPKKISIWVTRHGPVVLSEAGRNLTMRWSANDGFGYPFLSIAQARNWEQFRTSLSAFWGPGQNFVYADRAGNIGYQAAGRVPIRNGFRGNISLDGASGQFEWGGYIPFDQMPHAYNPPSGIIATANQNPFSADQTPDGGYADSYRVEQIRTRLLANTKLDTGDMLALAKDVYSHYDHFLAQQVIAAVTNKGGSADTREAVGVLRTWDGQMDKDKAAPLLTQLLHRELSRALLFSAIQAPSQGQPTFPLILPHPSVIQAVLRERPAGWVTSNDWDTWIVQRLSVALAEGRKLQGSPITNWRWGKVLRWNIQHPIGKRLPFVDGFFDIGPVEMSGSETTVKQTTPTKGPSERIVVQFGDLEKSLANITTGESGHVASPHYKDQWPSYYVGNSFPMQFQYVDAKEILRVVPIGVK